MLNYSDFYLKFLNYVFKIFKKLFVHFSESDAWELELEPLIESHMMWVLGTKLRCSPRQNVLLMA